MPRPPIDLARRIKDIVQHVQAIPDEALVPILHYRRTAQDIWASLAYVERALGVGSHYDAVVGRHLGRFYAMALVNLVETFERFLKELAAECIDVLADYVADDRFDIFSIRGSALASHFDTGGTLGRSLCESSTWLDCEEISKRFRKILSEPYQAGAPFDLFARQPADELRRFETMNLIWQLRHTAVHNVGIVTRSDALKLRLWTKEPVAAPRMLSPTRSDIRYLKRFLDETATLCNRRVGERLAQLITAIHSAVPESFAPKPKADRLSDIFRMTLHVAGEVGEAPND